MLYTQHTIFPNKVNQLLWGIVGSLHDYGAIFKFFGHLHGLVYSRAENKEVLDNLVAGAIQKVRISGNYFSYISMFD